MSNISDDQLLQQALNPAFQDRESLADAYGGLGEVADDAMKTGQQIMKLQGKKLAKLTPAQSRIAFKAFLYAEQWETGLTAAQPQGSKERMESDARAVQYREVRHRLWGKTKLEVFTESATESVPLIPNAGQGRSAPGPA